MGARRPLPRGGGAAGVQDVGRGQTRRQVRVVCCRAAPAPRDVKSLGEGGRVGGCAASSAALTRRGGRSSRWGRDGASVGARRSLSRGSGAARRAVKSLGGGRSVGRRAAFVRGHTTSVAARSQHGVTSSRWGRADAAVVARRLWPHGRGAVGGQVVGRGQARRWVHGVLCCVDAARRAVKSLGGRRRVGTRAAFVAARTRLHVRSRRSGGAGASVVARRRRPWLWQQRRREQIPRGNTDNTEEKDPKGRPPERT